MFHHCCQSCYLRFVGGVAGGVYTYSNAAVYSWTDAL